MIASKTNSEEAVELLLKNGANPDVVVKIDDEEHIALKFAIEAENIFGFNGIYQCSIFFRIRIRIRIMYLDQNIWICSIFQK